MIAGEAARDSIEIRLARPEETNEIIAVCGASLKWSAGDPNEAFFRWKHIENPFGASPIWVAVEDDAIVAVRTMMRWRLRSGDEASLSMVRAVDTATLPSHQGRGLFTRLTTLAVDELRDQGVDAVFNTPNDKSRPGYLKMGWSEVGRVPVTFRPRTPATAIAMARSRVAAVKWGEPTTFGEHPMAAFADTDNLDKLLQTQHQQPGISTDATPEYMRWRTSFGPLECRVLPLGDSIADGFVMFRLRERGELLQLSLLETVVPPNAGGRLRKAIGHLLGGLGADVALAAGGSAGLGDLMLPMPGAGPILTWRPLASSARPTIKNLALSMGAIELF